MCDIKNKSLAKRKPHLYQKQFTIFFLSCSQLPIRWMQSVLRVLNPFCKTFRMMLCSMAGTASPGWAVLELCPAKTARPQVLSWTRTDYMGRRPAWSLIPLPCFAQEETCAGPPAVAFQGTEPRPYTSGTGLSLLMCQHKPKPSRFIRRFSQFPLDKHPIKYLNP